VACTQTHVILFGEQLSVREFVAAQLAVKAPIYADCVSSLETAPASDFRIALQYGARLVIINYQPTSWIPAMWLSAQRSRSAARIMLVRHEPAMPLTSTLFLNLYAAPKPHNRQYAGPPVWERVIPGRASI